MRTMLLLLAVMMFSFFPVWAAEEEFDVVIDSNGKASEKENIPFGKLSLIGFQSGSSVQNLILKLDRQIVFQGPVLAGIDYPIGLDVLSLMELNVQGGPANQKVKIKTNYGFSPFAFIKVNKQGILVAGTMICRGRLKLQSFTPRKSSKLALVFVDGLPVFSGEVQAGKAYKINETARHKIIISLAGWHEESADDPLTLEYVYEPLCFFSLNQYNNSPYQMVATTDANGDVAIKDFVFENKETITLLGFQWKAGVTDAHRTFQNLVLFLNGQPVPIQIKNAPLQEGLYYQIQALKIPPGRHTCGIFAQQGPSYTNVCFALCCKTGP